MDSTSLLSFPDPMDDLRAHLNSCRGPSYTKITELRAGLPYRIVSFERVKTRIGDTIAVTLEGMIGDDFFLRVYLPPRFYQILTVDKIRKYNLGQGDRLSLQWKGGLSNNIGFL